MAERPVIVDVGKSEIRCWYEGRRSSGPGMPPETAARPGAGDELGSAVAAVIGADEGLRCDPERVGAVVVATTHLPPERELARAAEALAGLAPSAAIIVVEDGIAAHALALGERGVLVSAGTGTIVQALSAKGEWVRRDGWGPDAGDRGSAWEIGRAGISAAFSALDGVGPSTVLSGAFAERFGAEPGLATATALLSAPDRVARVAAFATSVLDAAESGDEASEAIVAAAVAAVVASARSAAAATRTQRVMLRGGLSRRSVWAAEVVRRLAEDGLQGEVSRRQMAELDPETLLAEPYRSACALVRRAR